MPAKTTHSFAESLKNIPTALLQWKDETLQKLNGFTEHKLPAPLKKTVHIFKNSFTLFNAHDTSTLGAGLSYYMIFSIAPLLMIVIVIAGWVLGPDAVSGALEQQIQGLFGPSTAHQLQDMVKSAYKPGHTWIATTISVILLITGAIGVFDQLRSSLNIIWDVKPGEKKPFFKYLLQRLFSFGMIGCMAFLLLVSLMIHTALAALSGYLDNMLPHLSKVILEMAETIFSFAVTVPLFAFIYKFMSDIKIKWRSVWLGAIFTAVLFAAGKYLIGLYISKSNLANSYGAASSVIIVLLWVYYSSQIVFFGAEFTRAIAEENGIILKDQKQS